MPVKIVKDGVFFSMREIHYLPPGKKFNRGESIFSNPYFKCSADVLKAREICGGKGPHGNKGSFLCDLLPIGDHFKRIAKKIIEEIFFYDKSEIFPGSDSQEDGMLGYAILKIRESLPEWFEDFLKKAEGVCPVDKYSLLIIYNLLKEIVDKEYWDDLGGGIPIWVNDYWLENDPTFFNPVKKGFSDRLTRYAEQKIFYHEEKREYHLRYLSLINEGFALRTLLRKCITKSPRRWSK